MSEQPEEGEADPRPKTFTGRPDPISLDPTIAQIQQEREALHRSNAGKFTIEEREKGLDVKLPDIEHRDPVFTVLAMMVILNVAKLCMIIWIVLTVLQMRDEYKDATYERMRVARLVETVKEQLDRGIDQQQILTNRIDDTLVRLGQQPLPSAR